MKYIYHCFAFLLLSTLMGSCQLDENVTDRKDSDSPQIQFLLSPIQSEIIENPTTRGIANNTAKLQKVWYALFDATNHRVYPIHHKLASDLSAVYVEGLSAGSYTLAVLATTENKALAPQQDVETIAQKWLANPNENLPFDKDYLHGKLSFNISTDTRPTTMRVDLNHLVSCLRLELNPVNVHLLRYVEKVELIFNPTSHVSTSVNVDGSIEGSAALASLDMTKIREFYSFPSINKMEGTVRITSSCADSSRFVTNYPFDNLKFESGKIALLQIDYKHPEDNNGRFYVPEKSYTATNSSTMFLDSEPRSVFYDQNKRSFYANEPLKIRVSNTGILTTQLFAPVTLHGVRIMARFPKYSQEYFEMVQFETIRPFQESWLELPITKRACTFVAKDGKRITIPKLTNFATEGIDLKIVSEEPYLMKARSTPSHWYIRFSPYSADGNHPYWRHMTAELCRHACALTVNMAYLFSTLEFNAELTKYQGVLKDNAQNPIDIESLRARILNHPGLAMGNVVGVGGLGGGETYGLADYCYRGVYFDATPLNSNPHNYDRMAMFHEYGHCLGYGHESNMTYGGETGWTELCARMFVTMGKLGKLPVNSKDEVGRLPRF